jgi:glycosyltransferase involved in cell wall biosynthesis
VRIAIYADLCYRRDGDTVSTQTAFVSANGLPIVATAVGGVPGALAHGERGILVPPGDAPAIAGAIARLGAEPERRAATVRAGYAWVAGDTTDLQVDRVARFIEGIVMADRS